MTTLVRELSRQRPDIGDPEAIIEAGLVLVDGRPVGNPASRVRPGCSLVVREDAPLRGEAKLRGALDHFAVAVEGRGALGAGAAAGGFTRGLPERGAARGDAGGARPGQPPRAPGPGP